MGHLQAVRRLVNMTRSQKKMTVNSYEYSLISDIVNTPSIFGKKKAAKTRQEMQNSIILNETNTLSGLTQQMQSLTIDDFGLRF